MSRTVIVLAAGEGKRMKSELPKVLHSLLGRSLVGHVLAAVAPLRAERTVVVVGHGRDQVEAHLAAVAPDAETVVQADRRGTGHAVRLALPAETTGTVIVLAGDAPLLRPETVSALVAAHEAAGASATVLAARVPDPTGLGRILRDADGGLTAIVEERDASPEIRAINEINSGVYAFEAAALRTCLNKLTTENQQGEEYLTDVIGLLRGAGERVAVEVAADHTEVLGCNDRVQLAQLGGVLRDRVNERLMRSGVTIVDPATTWIDVTVTCAQDVIIEPATYLRGTTSVGAGAQLGPEVTLIDTEVGAGASVIRAHAVSAVIGPRASVGPYAYLRPGAHLGTKSKAGTFVEIKNSSLGEGTKVPHLSYVGDATIGDHTNIGAANVFANYSGSVKSRTIVGSYVKTGSDTTLVAPVEVGDGAYTGAGAVIRRDVPPGALAFTSAMQRNIDGWVLRKRPGTEAAEAAARALDEG